MIDADAFIALLRENLRDCAFVAVPRPAGGVGEDAFEAATERAATGQDHTFVGERGMRSLRLLKLRDVADAVATVMHRRGLDARDDRDAVAQEVCLLLEFVLGGSQWCRRDR